MRARVLTVAVLFGLAVLAGSLAEAQLSEKYASWADGPAGFLLTKKESKEWKDVSTDAEAKGFIELFWARRDPDLDTPFNEFKARFDQIVAKADEEFAWDGGRGALTDRGKVMILLGPPHAKEHRAPTETVELMDDLSAGSDEVRANAWMWAYDPSLLPPQLNVKGPRLVYVFYEERAGSNNFVLDRSHQEAALSNRTLSKAPEAWFLHPKLTEVPKPVSVVGGTPADSAQLAWLEVDRAPFSESAAIRVEPGVADPRYRPLWVHVQLPPEAPELTTLAGRVSTPDGEEVSTFQIAAEPLAAGDARAYHLTFPLEEGSYRVELAGAANGVPQMVHSAEVELPAIPDEGTWFSPMWVGLGAQRDAEAPRGMAYCFGLFHLIPLVTDSVPKASELSYFGFVIRPGQPEEGEPSLKIKLSVSREGKRLGNAARFELPLAKLADDVYVYARSLPLGGFPETGPYTLDFELTDPVSGTAFERLVQLELTD